MAKISDVEIPSLLFTESAAPSTPASGFGRLYVKTTGLFFKGDDGVEIGPLAAGGAVSDTVYGAGWNGDTTTAPSKNAVYDKIETLGSGTGLLAVQKYAPAQTVLSSSSTSMVDVDATNMAVTFTAPTSGKVLVRLSAFGDANGAAAEVSWGLRESTTNLTSGKVMRIADAEGFLSVSFYLTGLSAGSHTYKWSHGVAAGGQTSRIIVGPGAAIGDFPGGLLEVWSAP